ncbi:hypothetical protein ABZ723_20170 [Streptomyces sp. NPDC006700]|uniref:hypothetical protein n=1 Tax=unclassified Streptomyces TaxID=2593676 RepID=UPI000C278859|nr:MULTISPECIES: hypothetical protein [unclassified Streptomyces]PJM92821.1 hypothetical protein CG719_26280 [Streptomyces sp. CB01373]WSB25101.1 hypothetical protein OIE49_03905 [Streptomyces sp. NBC_01788]
MRRRLTRALATGLAAGVMAGGAAVASVGTASAAPAKSTTSYGTAHHNCHKVKGHYFTTRHGKRVWVSEHMVCTTRMR